MTTVVLARGPKLRRPNGELTFAWGEDDEGNRVKVQQFLYRGRNKRAEQARRDMIKRPAYYGLSKKAAKRMRKAG